MSLWSLVLVCCSFRPLSGFRQPCQTKRQLSVRVAVQTNRWINGIIGSGIGRAVAYTLVTQGLTILVCADVNLSQAQETATSSYAVAGREGYEATAYHVDVREEAQVRALVAKTKNRYGRIDICITTAGVSQSSRGFLLRMISDHSREDPRCQSNPDQRHEPRNL